MAPPIQRLQWLSQHGLSTDPFAPSAFRAETDRILLPGKGGFSTVRYWDEVRGETEAGATFIFTTRGGGKSTMRLRIEQEINEKLAKGQSTEVVVVYNDFDVVLQQANFQPKDVKARYHIDQIIRLILQKLFELTLAEDSRIDFNKLNKPYQSALMRWYVRSFASGLHAWQIGRLLNQTGEPLTYEKLLFFDQLALTSLRKLMPSYFLSVDEGEIQKAHAIDAEDLLRADKEKLPLSWLLESLAELVNILGFEKIFVLIDDVTQMRDVADTRDNSSVSDLISSLATAPKLIGAKGYVFKFFLPIDARETAYSALPLDAFSQRTFDWDSRDDFKTLLSDRLKSCGGPTFESFSRLCNEPLRGSVDNNLADFGFQYRSPRAMLLMGDMLLAEHLGNRARTSKTMNEQDLISSDTWDNAKQKTKRILKQIGLEEN